MLGWLVLPSRLSVNLGFVLHLDLTLVPIGVRYSLPHCSAVRVVHLLPVTLWLRLSGVSSAFLVVALFLGYLPCSLILSSLSCSLVSALGFGLSRTLGLGDPVPFTVVLAVPHVGACCMQSLLGSDPVSPCSASLVLTFLGPVLLLVAAFIFWLFWDQSSLSPFA